MTPGRRANLREVRVWAALVAAFHARLSRDPDQAETDELIRIARDMAASGVSTIH